MTADDDQQQTSPEGRRAVTMERTAAKKFTVTNARGGRITTGAGEDSDFTPGELLLAAIGACTGVDVDILVSRRAEPLAMRIEVAGEKVKDEHGNRLDDLVVTFDAQFPEGASGDAAREVLPKVVARSRASLCTVGRTVEIGTPIRDDFGVVPPTR